MAVNPNQKKSFLATLNSLFERKAIKGFADRIKAFADLDAGMQAALRPSLAPGDPVRMILFAPAQSVLARRPDLKWLPRSLLPWEITPERTLVLTERRLLVASTARTADESRETRLVGEKASSQAPGSASAAQPPEITDIPLADILYLESGTVLLNSWFEIAWAREGQLERTRIVFNTVSRLFFEELCGLIRLSIQQSSALPPAPAAPKGQGLELLQDMPYKFKSLIPLRLLLAGEPIQAAAFQPSIWKRTLRFFRTHQAPKMAFVRTPGHLILAQEELTSEENNYGLTAQFCPLRSVRFVVVDESPSGLQLVVTLVLHGVELDLRRPLLASSPPALQQILSSWL